jgi:hypothetical protein
MTMWRPNEAAKEDVLNLAGIDPQSKHRRSGRRVWRGGLADQTVVKTLEDVRSYRAFERALIGSVDPRSVLELALVHRLASLLWRLRRACAIETGLFEIQGELLLAHRQEPCRPTQLGTLPTPTRANGHKAVLGSNGRDDLPASEQPWSKSRTIAQCLLRLSHLDPTLLAPWAATKRDCGAKPRKRFGPSRRCDSRRLQCGSDCATGPRHSPGIERGRSQLTHGVPTGAECSDEEGCVRCGPLRK